MCRQLGYSKQAFYKSIRNKQVKRCHHQLVKNKVLAIRKQMPRIGVRKLHHLLKADFAKDQIHMGRDRLLSLLREENLLVKRKKKYIKTTNSLYWMRQYPDRVKGIRPRRPEQIWVADITYLTLNKGYCYLHLITDAYSKKIMGFMVSKDLSAAYTAQALQQAIQQRQYKSQLTHHSDRGLQYCSSTYVKLLTQNNIAISMTQDGNPYDNAIAERVNGILKDEFGLDDTFLTINDAAHQTQQAVNLYNKSRPHLSCAMMTPEKMHQQNQVRLKAWHKKSTKILKDFGGFLP